MALEDQIRTLNWKSNWNNEVNTSINGKTYVADFGNHYWSFTIETPPITRADFQNNFFVLFNDIDSTARIQIKAPVINDAEGRPGSTDPSGVGPTQLIGTGFAGAYPTDVTVDLLDDTTVGMELTNGDFVQFANHGKVYMVNGNHSIDPNDYGGSPTQGQITVTPPLIKTVSNQDMKINDISVNVVAIGDTVEYQTDVDGLFVFSKEVREVV
tara:strand:+ start:14913 stop:15548 length:636 start_codon:yes stop_codon:yes gene_type:complete